MRRSAEILLHAVLAGVIPTLTAAQVGQVMPAPPVIPPPPPTIHLPLPPSIIAPPSGPGAPPKAVMPPERRSHGDRVVPCIERGRAYNVPDNQMSAYVSRCAGGD
jgi:hypothetical protein